MTPPPNELHYAGGDGGGSRSSSRLGGDRNPLGELNANHAASADPALGPEADFDEHKSDAGNRGGGAYVVGELVDVLDTVGKWCEGQIKEVSGKAFERAIRAWRSAGSAREM